MRAKRSSNRVSRLIGKLFIAVVLVDEKQGMRVCST